MTTDQIIMTVSTFAAVVFAFMYYKATSDFKTYKLDDKQQRSHDLMWREMDNISDRLNKIEDRCNCCPQMSTTYPVNNQGSVSY